MVHIQVRDVPKHVHAKLKERAAAAGQSLQEYLVQLLTYEAETSTNAELLAEIEREMAEHPEDYATGSLDEIVAIIREDRESH